MVCVWVADGKGKVLMTRRAKEKTFAGTWENSGGAAQAGETSRQAIARELFEETGIRVDPEEFRLIDSGTERNTHYDYYTVVRDVPLEEIVLLPGETDDVKWVSFDQVAKMIKAKQICKVISRQYMCQKEMIPGWQNAQK